MIPWDEGLSEGLSTNHDLALISKTRLSVFTNLFDKIDLSRVSDAILFRRQKWSFQNDHIYIFNQKGMKELRNLDKTWQLC